MTIPVFKVEVGFDLTFSPNPPFFVLDDATKGVLDNTQYPLSGVLFYDVTDKVKTIAIQRGKNRALDQYDQGLANVVFNNNDRTFDPEYAASPFFGQIIPKRQIRVTANGVVQFFGVIDDWNLYYEPNGDSTVAAACSDATSFFATQTLATRTNDVEFSGERVNTILSLPEVNWPTGLRDIETGQMELGADTVPDNTNVLSYLRLIEKSEAGSFFVSKAGEVVFKDRNVASQAQAVTLADDGTGIAYTNMTVEYGSENLHNEIVLTSEITSTEAIAQALDSINEYGILTLTRLGLLLNDDTDLVNLSKFFASKYAQPEYRFQSVDIIMERRTVAEQNLILGLEIGDVVTIKFTPNGLPPAIEKAAEIIRIDHSADSISHVVSFGFATTEKAAWTLSDPIFGKLSAANVMGF